MALAEAVASAEHGGLDTGTLPDVLTEVLGAPADGTLPVGPVITAALPAERVLAAFALDAFALPAFALDAGPGRSREVLLGSRPDPFPGTGDQPRESLSDDLRSPDQRSPDGR